MHIHTYRSNKRLGKYLGSKGRKYPVFIFQASETGFGGMTFVMQHQKYIVLQTDCPRYSSSPEKDIEKVHNSPR